MHKVANPQPYTVSDASIWSKNKGGEGSLGPFPGSATEYL